MTDEPIKEIDFERNVDNRYVGWVHGTPVLLHPGHTATRGLVAPHLSLSVRLHLHGNVYIAHPV